MDLSAAGAQSTRGCCQVAEAAVFAQEAGRAAQKVSQLATLGERGKHSS